MFRNYLITSYRFILKSRTYAVINMTGLVAGLSAAFILLIFTLNELSYDRYHTAASRIFRVISSDSKGNQYALSSYDFGPAIEKKSGEVQSMVRIACPAFITGPLQVSANGVLNTERGFYCADSQIVSIFDLELLKGNVNHCLSDPSSVMISDRRASEYFAGVDPVGKQILVKTAGITMELNITGVYRALPWNSTLQMDWIASMDVFPAIMSGLFDSLTLARQMRLDPALETFLLLNDSGDPFRLEQEIPVILRETLQDTVTVRYSLQPLKEVYLGSEKINDMIHKKGNRSAMYIYSSLALFVLLLAGINYSILSTARSALRYKEIGVRKVLGATRKALSAQVLTESILITFLSLPVSWLLIGLAEPALQWLFGYEVQVYSADTLILLPLFAAITIFIGLISGAYIAFYLSSLNPIAALKNKPGSHRRINLSRIFIVFQLFITLSLFISVITIYRQVNYCLNGNIGMNKNNLLVVSFDPNEFRQYERLKAELARLPGVVSVSGSSIAPPDLAIPSISTNLSSGSDESKVEYIAVDTGFFRTLGVTFAKGSDFEPGDSLRGTGRFIVNKALTAKLKEQSGTNLRIGGVPVVGIVNDFNLHTLHNPIGPAIFTYRPDMIRATVVRCSEGSLKMVKNQVNSIRTRLAPDQVFTIWEFNSELNSLYRKERIFGYVVAAFALLAFIIMGMGLFGLALLISERKVKETAIRKIFGASNPDILLGMQKEFMLYSLLATAFAIPSTVFLLKQYLNTFYYRIGLDWWVFALSALTVTVFVAGIILYRTIKMLQENPVKALKYE